jgi:acetyl-CoA acetyltransferase
MRPVYVLGAGAHPWGKFPNKPQVQLATEAMNAALQDAGLQWHQLNGLVAASSRFEGGMGWGLHANELLQSACENGIPGVNVGGGCAAGGIAIHNAYAMIASGQCDVVAAVGAERMPKGFIPRPPGSPDDISDTDFIRWVAMGATNPAYWALETRRRMHDFGTSESTLASASVLMHHNAVGNPLARYRKECSIEEVLASPVVSDPLHILEICAVSDGAAALVLGTYEQALATGKPLVQVAGCAIATGQFGDQAMRIPTVSTTLSQNLNFSHTTEVAGAVHRAMQMAGVEHKDIDVLEMADNTAWHLLAWPEMFGFFEPGQADWMLNHGKLGIHGGHLAINPSGGFLSFGEATTAQGVLQVCELAWQLRGQASGHQVPNPRVGLSAVLGLGANGASVVLKV